ncbi:MAG: glycerate kinase [Phycisphaerales bacterium]|nr:glycerate kinase [Phycisphaerales bacterium]
MKIVCAPDSFKESILAPQAAEAMARGVELAGATADRCPIADGGEGTMNVLLGARGGRRLHVRTIDPIGRTIEAEIGFLESPRLAIIEMAAASGLGLLKLDERRPLETTSFGTGQLIAIASREVDHVLLAAGGTATVDGGCGILQALGARCLDSIGQPIEDPINGGTLTRLASIELPLGYPTIDIAADVVVPLLGQHGAAHMFGPQKGADEQTVEQLEANLLHLADILDPDGTKRQIQGGGAAGGAGFGLHAALDARIQSGIEYVLEAVRFNERIQDADMLIVGEGCMDTQTLLGKACGVTANHAARHGINSFAICGKLGNGWQAALAENGGPFQKILSLTDQFGEDRALHETAECLQEAAKFLITAGQSQL